MTVHQAKAVLSIKPIYSLVMLLGTLLCIALGVWQFTKAQQFEHKDVPSSSWTGQLQTEPILFLDNRTQAGQAGYHVYSVFNTQHPKSGGAYYLLNRGFVPLDAHTRLPVFGLAEQNKHADALAVTGEMQTIQAREQAPAKPMVLSGSTALERLPAIAENAWRVQTINIELLSELTGLTLNKNILVQVRGAGMMQALPESEPYMSRHKHLAYAVQWWLLAVAAVVIWLWSSWQGSSSQRS